MFVSETKIRVLYADTDKMGYVYYGNYPKYYELGRTEAIRELGISYSGMEESGVAMPVINMSIKYIKPAFYDDLLTIRTIIDVLPTTRMHFKYEIINQNSVLINTGETTLIFLNLMKNKPVRAPEYLLSRFRKYFEVNQDGKI